MKTFLVCISLFLTGCTTVYKVDERGVCRNSKGEIVKEPVIKGFVEPYKTVERHYCPKKLSIYSNVYTGGTAQGGFYGSNVK